jgi:hypothetical protein
MMGKEEEASSKEMGDGEVHIPKSRSSLLEAISRCFGHARIFPGLQTSQTSCKSAISNELEGLCLLS